MLVRVAHVTAVDARTGKTIWSTGFPSQTYGAPTYANGLVYQTWLDGHIRVFNARTGDLVTTITTPPLSLPPPLGPFIKNFGLATSVPIVNNRLVVTMGTEFAPIGGGGVAVYGLP